MLVGGWRGEEGGREGWRGEGGRNRGKRGSLHTEWPKLLSRKKIMQHNTVQLLMKGIKRQN